MTESQPVPAPVSAAVEAWLEATDRLAPGVVEGLYLVGSVALDDWRSHSDIDVVAFVSDPTDVDTVAALRAAHEEYVARGAVSVDGPFLGWADVISPPLSVQRPWTLADGFHFDAECFEINPVTWCTLALHAVAVRGPDVSELGAYLDADDRRMWVRRNVDGYWRGVGIEIDRMLDADPQRDEFGPELIEWCALGIARMAYTSRTGDVTSKSGAGEWAIEAFPRHRVVLERALAIRMLSGGTPVDRAMMQRVRALIGDVVTIVVV